MKPNLMGQAIRIRGVVQGVGFRPYVWQIAQQLNIKGWVKNDAEGVLINAWADSATLEKFATQLTQQPPTLASIHEFKQQPLSLTNKHPENFTILNSEPGLAATAIATDTTTCSACLSEIHDPNNRRYRYPFTNCSHCGPRFTIIQRIPYDRANTSMSLFPLCHACHTEFEDPSNRRFHAQPNTCSDCGPRLWLEDRNGSPITSPAQTDAIDITAQRLKQGAIIAIKGLGGFHLACNGTSEAVVNSLRQRKKRCHKAFALMAKDCESIRTFAELTTQQESILRSPAAPIVILEKKHHSLPKNIAPQQSGLGFMLPYTPLHHLLMESLDFPIVLTSGNLTDEPQAITNDQAREQLHEVADYFLLHDREIINRMDDSVIKVIAGKPRIFRRGRGLAPQPISLPEGFQQATDILAMGADLKNTFCVIKNGQAIVSQHMGDLGEPHTQRDYRQQIEKYKNLFQLEAELIVIDKHPNYQSSQHGKQLAVALHKNIIEVQHHHAHITSCMAEHGLPLNTKKVLGIALDGLGFGDDARLWGSEFLLADYTSSQRIGFFKPVPMLGGNQAMKEPWRSTLAHLMGNDDQTSKGTWQNLLEQHKASPICQLLLQQPLDILASMAKKNINSPMSSSAGRLFDAVAALLNLCPQKQSFEGQAAMALEAAAAEYIRCESTSLSTAHQSYPYQIIPSNIEDKGQFCINWAPLWPALFSELADHTDRTLIAARFHYTLANALCDLVVQLSNCHTFSSVVLSGGVMQNQLLTEQLVSRLSDQFELLIPRKLPCNDGGLSLGQAVVGYAKSQQRY